jgi:hypothetical protein
VTPIPRTVTPVPPPATPLPVITDWRGEYYANLSLAGYPALVRNDTVVDFYRTWRPGRSDAHYLGAGRLFTVGWGLLAMLFAAFASLLDNLIQAVNILGSIFYGPMLGVFLVGFFLKWVRPTPVFIATLVAQAAVVGVFALSKIGFLWYNVIGCGALVVLALALDVLWPRPATAR